MPCLFSPLCKMMPQKNGYCVGHQAFANGVSVSVPKEVNKESNNMKELKKQLKKLYQVFLSKHTQCQLKISPDCTKVATCVHHVHGRLKDNVLNENSLKASCEACNLYVEIYHKEAAEKGLKKSKFIKAK